MALSIKELITQYKEEYDYCEEQYMSAWQAIVTDIDENASENRKTAAQRNAQKMRLTRHLSNPWHIFLTSTKKSSGH